ncbi:hypothetical protein [Larkinella humicola]|uniref:Nucleotide-diphospho-sugar transferase domain-containing protein n=1 Tax=Larkinella humicola TaxID=2607654 RepID=A0A5N1JKS2_9BACT|nr:hypothetical protein [Larkinella humicola]KAA9356711.1 hypothetical protein F0P93_02900 [Larkinella humicola]
MINTSPTSIDLKETVPGTTQEQNKKSGGRSGIPIIFVHQRYSFYLEYTLRQAAHSNPDSPIHLLGDVENNRFPFLIHHNVSDLLNPETDWFKSVYQHQSPNHYDYELFCFVRWYLVKELMRREGYRQVFVADSDVMIYSDITHYVNQAGLTKYQAAYNIGVDYQWVRSASGHSSYWTWEGISQFCNLMSNLYTEPRFMTFMDQIRAEKIIKNDRAGISDMTALYIFYEEENAKIRNLSACQNGSAFDHNISMATNYDLDEYEFGLGRKKIVIKNGHPVAYNVLLKKEIVLHTLHFQGNSKNIIHRYYTGGGLLANKTFRELRFRASVLYHMVK